MDTEVLAEAVELTRARTPFALATVVWRRSPSSGHTGSKGVVLSDGTVVVLVDKEAGLSALGCTGNLPG